MCYERTMYLFFFKLIFFQTFILCFYCRLIPSLDNNSTQSLENDFLILNDVKKLFITNFNKISSSSHESQSNYNEVPLEIDINTSGKLPTLHISGIYSGDNVRGGEHEMTVPKRVAADGAFMSHALHARHAVTAAGGRVRRSLAPGDTLHPHDTPDLLYYNITVGGRDLTLLLRPELGFISPHLMVERRVKGQRYTRSVVGEAGGCHYRGQIAGQPTSHVTLSACNGLVGMLRTEQGEYWMEPVKDEVSEGAEHPHVIYKRAAGHPPPPEEGKNGKKKGKGQGRKGKGKKKRKRRQKNCGTKQPPRPETSAKAVQWTVGPGRTVVQHSVASHQHNKIGSSSRSANEEVHRRSPRSISRPRHVEVLLVADSTMTAFHQKGNVETYLLTIMNMVSSLYLDPTIGNFINVVVVRIILLEEGEVGGDLEEASVESLDITTNADTALNSFCRWQRDLNPPGDSHPNHHDVAILITRKDICARQNVPCSTLGVAHVAGMCLPDRSCSVNEDNGITLAHTITHELGHNFGMYHDTEKIGCHRRIGSTLHVMTPIFEADTVEVAWSRCSRRDLTNFLDSGMGECLADQPAHVDYIYPELPPGALYDAGRQCRLQFGAGVEEVCTELAEICQRLWCVVNGICTTMLRPAAPGTECGQDMWCQNHTCVARTSRPPPVAGGWGEWGPWSSCSRSCGAGVSVTKRLCDSPRPAHGGNFCTGERTRYKVCNTNPCPKTEPSFRQIQCSKYDNTTYEGKVIQKWQPYFDQDEPCELYCSTADESVIVPFGEYALDGTPCNLGTRDMCISGICKKVGCDWQVDSNATEDACGVCNGNGTDCKQIQGIYSMGTTKESGYSEVAIIPAGSRNIKIEEVSNSKNYIGIGSAKSRKFYLNGKRKITLAGEYLVAGTPALYERDRDWEKVKIPGPIKEDILIYQMIYRGRHRNPGVRYQYTVDKRRNRGDSSDGSGNFRWGAGDWTPCSRSCGNGIMKQPVICLNNTNGIVEEELCISNSEMERPSELMRVCNTQPCLKFWWVGPWANCPPCLKQNQQQALRRRKVLCRNRQDNQQVAETECDIKNKPIAHINCVGLPKCHHRY